MRSFKFLLVVSTSLALAACIGAEKQMHDDSGTTASIALTGSVWRLAEIRYPTSNIRIGDAETYTLLLQPDGRASLQLDCNRGFGQWTASSHHDGKGGKFAISDMGVTKAMCSPTSKSDKVTADIQRFAKFIMEGENLVISVADDSASYVWTPSSESGEAGPE